MKIRSLWLAAAITMAASLNPASAEEGLVEMGMPIMGIDEAGLASIVGDVLADYAISSVELLVDGEFKANIPVQDGEVVVGEGIAGLLGSGYTDFSGAAFLGLLQPGMHEVTVRVTDAQGNVQEVTTPIEIPNYFAEDTTEGEATEGEQSANSVDLSGAELSVAGENLRINNLQVNGNAFNMSLEWNPQTGKFEVSSALPLALFLDDLADDEADDSEDEVTDEEATDIDSDDFMNDEWFLQFVDPEDRWVFE